MLFRSQELQEQEEKAVQAREALAGTQKELDKVAEDRDGAKNVISGYQMRLQSRQRKLEQVQEKHRRLQMDENNLNSRIKMLSEMEKLYEGYSKAVKLVMNEAERNGLRGVRGPVASLIHVPDQYAVAVEIALGGAMQNLVVERDEDGKNAISYLKRRDGGRCTFLPMNTIRPADFRDRAVEREDGFVGMGDTLISFDREYANIFSNLLGRVVIARDMDRAMAMARKFGHRFRIVTLDGQVLNAGGSMTGGSVSRSAGILSRANELERLRRQKDGLGADLKTAADELAQAQREVTAAQYELETASAQLREAEDAVLKYSERTRNAKALLEDIEQRRQILAGERGQVRRRMEENTENTAQAKGRIETLEGSAAALRAESEAKAQGRTALQDRITELNEEAAQHSARLAGLEGEQSALRLSIDELERLRDDLSGDTASRAAMIGEFEHQNDYLMRRIQEEEERLQRLKTASQEGQSALRKLNEEKLALEGQRNQTERQ